ncbi:MAG: hypothetical protein IID37_03000 [Planctomycetes bacterium]|nr:hypothetical protein [Planctomycetota bacterium]
MNTTRWMTLGSIILMLGAATGAPVSAAADSKNDPPARSSRKASDRALKPASTERLALTVAVGKSCADVAQLLGAVKRLGNEGRSLSFDHNNAAGTVTVVGPKRIIKKLGRTMEAVKIVAESGPKRLSPPPPPPAGPELAVRVFEIRHALARDLVKTIDALHRTTHSPWVAIADSTSNSLVLKGWPAELNEAAEVIAQLDRPRKQKGQVMAPVAEIVPLAHADAYEMRDVILAVASATRGDVEIMRIVPDERTNSLILVGGRSQIYEARRLITIFDVAPGEMQFTPAQNGGSPTDQPVKKQASKNKSGHSNKADAKKRPRTPKGKTPSDRPSTADVDAR